MTEGPKHHKATERLAKLLIDKGFAIDFDKRWGVPDNDRVSDYYPDLTATLTFVFEVNGNVGHSSKRSFDNEQNQKKWFEGMGVRFFVYSPSELVGNGWIDSKGHKHKPHADKELYADWGL